MTETKLTVSAAPHIATPDNNKSIMLDVLIALAPAVIASGFFFGLRAYIVVLISVCACVVAEFIYQWLYRGLEIKKKKNTTWRDALSISQSRTDIGDLSAAVTGVLLAMNMPPAIPLWMVAIGAVFAVILVKQLFGGLGHNFVNPALAARAFMLACWGGAMSAFSDPVLDFGRYIIPTDAVTSATPLALIKGTATAAGKAIPTLYDVFIGRVGGSLGETSAFLLIIGGIYLLLRNVIDWKTPVCYLGSFAVLVYFFGQTPYSPEFVAYNLCVGGLILGAFFMATDYVTTPTTGAGHAVFGIGCGIITFVIRRFGAYPEGVTYAILLMNVLTPLIDKHIRPRRFGVGRFGNQSGGEGDAA